MFGWFRGSKRKNEVDMNQVRKERIAKDLEAFQKAVEVKLQEILNAPCDLNIAPAPGSINEEDRYTFTHPRRGLAVIINNEKFGYVKNLGDRNGSSADAHYLFNMFKLLGFQVLHATNLTAQKMLVLLKTVAKHFDHQNSDCFACSILSHGDQIFSKKDVDTCQRKDILYGVDGETLPTELITEIFDDQHCQALIGKPRLFFFQACRGDTLDEGVDITVLHPRLSDTRKLESTEESSSVDPPDFGTKNEDDMEARAERHVPSEFYLNQVVIDPAPLYKDCLVMYATPPGYYAWRRGTGAWFIQSLCDVLTSDPVRFGEIDLQKALVHVSRNVAYNYESNMPENKKFHAKKESPVLYSMLVKDIYFNVTRGEAMNI
nr:caspase-7-like [Biomphalaria glabrata]